MTKQQPIRRTNSKDATVKNSDRLIKHIKHPISNTLINKNALKVLSGLAQAGYAAYLVGGSVRDLLIGRQPKDFDITTDAHPEQIRALFHNCRLIGRRFRLAHIYFGREIIEVATFRGPSTDENDAHPQSAHGMLLRDNIYGTLEEDVWRRDFTINALYYNMQDASVMDYTGGLDDLKKNLLRLIGDPEQRYREDPVRMLRAIRFASKLNLNIHPDTAEPIATVKILLEHVSPARLFDETLKILLGGASSSAFELLRKYDLFRYLFRQTNTQLEILGVLPIHDFLALAFKNTDTRLSEGKTINPAFMLAALLWYPQQNIVAQLEKDGLKHGIAFEKAAQLAISEQVKQMSIPKRLTAMVREIWTLQNHLSRRSGQHAYRLMNQPRFRAAYDFLLLRSAAGEDVKPLAEWWTAFQEGGDKEKQLLINEIVPPKKHKKINLRRKKTVKKRVKISK
jgi:poly(A) polymerase